MHILVSNDDGVHAPGIHCLATWLSKIATVTVVAPERNRSAASHSLTLHNPLRVAKLDNGFFSVNGTPTDCVHISVAGGLDIKPDMVVSGINAGANLGDDVMYSGTVAAAVEGRNLGYPAIAISLAGEHHSKSEHYETAGRFIHQFIQYLWKNPLPSDTILNINVPDVPTAELKGTRVCRLGSRHMSEKVLRDTDPSGSPIYWVGPPGSEQDNSEDTDFWAITHRYVSVTPIQLDMTRHDRLPALHHWLKDFK